MLSKYPFRNSDNAYREIDGEALIVDTKEGKLIALNETATLIWTLADGKHSVGEIIDRICRDFDTGRERAAEEAIKFINELVSKEMLTVAEQPVIEETGDEK